MIESWKEIAVHLHRNVRTCQMWEKDLGLPIHRLDGSPRARVFAYPDELDRWLHDKLHERETRPGRSRELPTLPSWDIGLIAALAFLSAGAIGTSAWLLDHQSKVRWANDVAIPEIERLLRTPDAQTPFQLLARVERIIPKAPGLASLRPLVTSVVSFVSDPPGATVWIKDYGAAEEAWQLLGLTPLPKTSLCPGYRRWKAEKPGFVPVEGSFQARAGFEREIRIVCDRPSAAPPGMVRVLGGNFRTMAPLLVELPAIELRDYYVDRFEVTNRQFQEFIDAGGYENRAFWRVPLALWRAAPGARRFDVRQDANQPIRAVFCSVLGRHQ